MSHLLLQRVKLEEHILDLLDDLLLFVLGVLDVAQGLLLEVALKEERLDVFELHEELLELLVVVLLDRGYFLPHGGQLVDLGLNLIMELPDLVLEVVDLELVQHDNIVVSVLSKKALKANGAQVIFAEGLDVLVPVDLALGEVLVSIRNYLLLLWLNMLG